MLDPESKEAWNDPKHPLRVLLKTQLQDAASVDASKVCLARRLAQLLASSKQSTCWAHEHAADISPVWGPA